MYRFDLDKAIASWRRNIRLNRAFLGEDLDELESHLRDHVERLVSEGHEERRAYKQALERLGLYADLQVEYKKVRLGRSKWHRSLLRDTRWALTMLGSYLTIARRNLSRHSFYAGLNIVGLAIGLASCLLILLYVSDELRYDKFHDRGDEIYRLNWDYSWNGREGMGGGTPPPLAAAMVREIPGIEATTRVYPVSDMVVRQADQFFTETRIFGVDANFLQVFSFPLAAGNPETVLSAPGSVVLTEETARKYFGEADPMGKPIRLGEDATLFGDAYTSTFTVTGVIENPPDQSHFDFDLLTSMSSHPQVEHFDWSWIWMQVATYAVVPDPTRIPDMETRLAELVADYAPPAFTRVGFSFDELISAGGHWDFLFQPMTDIYLGSDDIGNRVGPTGSRTNLYIFGLVAVFILLMACINSMNLSTARSTSRANEIGVRKALGSARAALVGQFMAEAMLFSVMAMVMAVILAAVLMGPFNQISGKSLSLAVENQGWLLGALIGMTVLTGLLAGSYPSFYLSGFRPIDVLKGSFVSGRRGLRFRNSLVVTQFAISIALIVCTVLVRSQMLFFRQADMGFEDGGVLVISNDNDRLGNRAEAFRQGLESEPGVLSAALTTGVPTSPAFEDYFKIEGKGDELYELASFRVDDAYIATLGLEIVKGQGFSPDQPSRNQSVILNEVAVAGYGWDDPIGKIVNYSDAGDFTVIGVVRDFNFRSMQVPIRPLALFHWTSELFNIPNSSIAVRVGPDNIDSTIDLIRARWDAIAPDAPFEFAFLDDTVSSQYESERTLERLFLIFAGLAIIIACLGLWGLAAFVAEKRTKEIGIRRSLGASVPSVLALLIRDFTKWVLMANLLAWPLAWLWARDWLQEFAFRVDIGFWPFLAAGAVAFSIAVLTVGYQALKTARANPVEALRYE
jgi:putative ABC transport system permease protein